ncbi:tyrosine-type recombinase/integrase [Cupriavidus pauculus]|uniref:Tyr recombinase domain-containing protein n=1 Tax=Cupriavidus pauculus TaxID=82633 RepID=A0A2N5C909_9BURK|nr:site-specific integrase [Cupriavidus pauculus]PLP98700.1 hypothetical protein CYJ10_20585 [Cupriavidus pauculus]
MPHSAPVARRTAYAVTPLRPSSATRRERLTVREVADAFMAQYTGNDPARLQVVARWCAYLGDLWIDELDAEIIAAALDDMAQTPIRRFMGRDASGQPLYKELNLPAPATVSRWRAIFSAILTFAVRRRLVPRGWRNPARDIELEAVRNARVRFLTRPEGKRLLKVSRLSSWPKLYLLILMALSTGARKSELMGLRWRDLDLKAAQPAAHVYKTKNGDDRVLPLTEEVVTEVMRQSRGASPDHLIFCRTGYPDRPFNFTKPWQQALCDARIEDFKFHDLRHTCASWLAQAGKGLHDIANVLGHRQLDVTRRYAHLTVDHKANIVQAVLGNVA